MNKMKLKFLTSLLTYQTDDSQIATGLLLKVEVDELRNFSVNIESAENCRAYKEYVTSEGDSENFQMLE